jgi:hypothetical protein
MAMKTFSISFADGLSFLKSYERTQSRTLAMQQTEFDSVVMVPTPKGMARLAEADGYGFTVSSPQIAVDHVENFKLGARSTGWRTTWGRTLDGSGWRAPLYAAQARLPGQGLRRWSWWASAWLGAG